MKQDLILRGLHIVIRMNAAPSEPTAQAKHFARLQSDIGPWLGDYVLLMGSEESTLTKESVPSELTDS